MELKKEKDFYVKEHFEFRDKYILIGQEVLKDLKVLETSENALKENFNVNENLFKEINNFPESIKILIDNELKHRDNFDKMVDEK